MPLIWTINQQTSNVNVQGLLEQTSLHSYLTNIPFALGFPTGEGSVSDPSLKVSNHGFRDLYL